MLALLYAHPNVYVDVAGLQSSPRAGIHAILDADFLSAEQKADILCNNAARFWRLAEPVCNP